MRPFNGTVLGDRFVPRLCDSVGRGGRLAQAPLPSKITLAWASWRV